MTAADMLAEQIDGSRDWTLKLLADVDGSDWGFQPGEGLHHIAWLCGHLAVAEHLLVLTRCLDGDPPGEAFASHFPIGEPVRKIGDHPFPSPEDILRQMAATHGEVLAAVRGMTDEQLAEPCYGKDGTTHPHYTTKCGALAHCARHEAFHAGQIAVLRRLMGKPFIR